MDVLKYGLFILHFLVSILLIGLVVAQTNRSEGLGMVGGSSSSGPVRGRAGLEEKLEEYTKYTAFVFMFLSAVLYMLAMKYHWT